MNSNQSLRVLLKVLLVILIVGCNNTKASQQVSSSISENKIQAETFHGVFQTPKDIQEIINVKGRIIVDDNFNRVEEDDTKEQLGENWETNSANRVQGKKQADLDGEILKVIRLKESNHQTSVRRNLPFDDGVVQVKFKIFGPKGVAFNFNDPKAKHIAHAGHLCQVVVRPDKVVIKDQLMGHFNNEIAKKKKSSNFSKEEIKTLLKDKQVTFNRNTSLNEWHLMNIVITGDVFEAYIDGEKVGQLKSPGIDHPVKQNLAFSVPLKGHYDDLKVWSLE